MTDRRERELREADQRRERDAISELEDRDRRSVLIAAMNTVMARWEAIPPASRSAEEVQYLDLRRELDAAAARSTDDAVQVVEWFIAQARAESTAAAVRSRGSRAVVARLDVTRLDEVAAVVDGMADELSGVDVCVNNAGGGGGTPFLAQSLAEWRDVVSLNLDGAFAAMEAAARRMVAAGRGGRIVAVTSVHEHQSRVRSSAYVADKHGLGGLLKTMAQELGADGITVNAAAPGEIATPMNDMSSEDAPRGNYRRSRPRTT